MKYINSFLKRASCSDLMPLFCQSKNVVKEISESYAAYKNLLKFIDANDPNVANIFIGDGSLCMTGAIFAFMTKNYNICIDPNINLHKIFTWMKEKSVMRLNIFKDIFEKFNLDLKNDYYIDRYNIVCVHAHVDLKQVVKKFPNWNYLYTNPCCKRDTQTLSLSFQKENNISTVLYGRDENILSEKNEVIIYKNGRT